MEQEKGENKTLDPNPGAGQDAGVRGEPKGAPLVKFWHFTLGSLRRVSGFEPFIVCSLTHYV